MTWRETTRRALDLLLPGACLSCRGLVPSGARGADALVCPGCMSRLRPLPPPWCGRCGAPTGRTRPVGTRCGECVYWPEEPLLRARSAVALSGVGADLVHALKYEGWRELARPMAERMVRLGAADTWHAPEPDRAPVVVVPVPTTPQRVRDRGYNQARILASEYAESTGFPLLDALERNPGARSQIALQPSDRAANVRGAFALSEVDQSGAPEAARIGGAHVLLIDDVMTTGATVAAAATPLLEAGAVRITALTFARALTTRG